MCDNTTHTIQKYILITLVMFLSYVYENQFHKPQLKPRMTNLAHSTNAFPFLWRFTSVFTAASLLNGIFSNRQKTITNPKNYMNGTKRSGNKIETCTNHHEIFGDKTCHAVI